MYSLYLYPSKAIEMKLVIATLKAYGLIGEELAPQRYHTGHHLFQFISFAGCSPQFHFEPPQAGSWDFCHFSVHQLPKKVWLYFAQGTKPRCPQCESRIKKWSVLKPEQAYTCPVCQQSFALDEIDFRHYGLYADRFIQLHQVHPREAVPGDILLERLQQGFDCDWHYAWAERFMPKS